MTVYLTLYSFIDFLCQLIYQMPYISELEFVDHIGMRKIYEKVPEDQFGYNQMITNPGTYYGFEINATNLLLQLLNCIVINLISTQSEIFTGEGFYRFVTGKSKNDAYPEKDEEECTVCEKKPDQSELYLFMEVASIKQKINDYDFNN